MIKFALAKEVSVRQIPRGSVILSPFAEQAISPADRMHALKNGLVVMDLTWSNIDDIPRPKGTNERALPFLIASNPVNWGRPMELNSAEAVVAALYILGEKEQALEFAKRFGWGDEFMRLNGNMLEDYSNAKDSTDVVRIQNEYLEAQKG
jgi:pre-rRNA-processing protein TSR3